MEYFKSRDGFLPKNTKQIDNYIKNYKNITSSKNDVMAILKSGDSTVLPKLKKLPKDLNLNEQQEIFNVLKQTKDQKIIDDIKMNDELLSIKDRTNVDGTVQNVSQSNTQLMEKLADVFKQINSEHKIDNDNGINQIISLGKDIVNRIDNVKVVKTPGKITKDKYIKQIDKIIDDNESLDLYKYIRDNEGIIFKDLKKQTPYAKSQALFNHLMKLDMVNEDFINKYRTVNNKDLAITDKIDDDNDSIEGSGFISSISSIISKYAPSVLKQAKIIAPSILSAGKKIISNPKNQKAALDFVKEKFKKKVPEKPKELTEREQLFQMFKNKEITATEYQNLKSDLSLPIIKEDVKEIKEINESSNLKNLSNEFDPKKIYLDLLTKKQITPEQYMNIITGGKKLNLSKPIDKDNFIEETTLKGEGFTKVKRRYKTKK